MDKVIKVGMGIFLLVSSLKADLFFLKDKAISYELVIITDESLMSAFTKFSSLKWSMGTPTKIVSVNWIYRNFSGNDRQEKIRNFIRYAKNNLNASYILIGGDVGVVPARTLYVPMNGTGDDFVPGDFYYMCLDGNFNADGDTLYGEPADSVDYTPDISVTRLPVNSRADVEAYISKELQYLFNPGDYLNKAVFIGSDITTPGSGAQFCIQVEDSFPVEFEKIEFYEDNSNNNNKNEIIDSLNMGAGFVYGNLHAQSFDRMLLNFTPRRPLTNFDVDNHLINVESPGFYDIVTCHVGGFDVDALAEHLIRNTAGAIGVYATTRLNYPVITISINKYFYSQLFNGGIRRLGDLDRMVRTRFAFNASSYITYRYVIYSYEMFGDPTLRLWTGLPNSLVVNAPSVITTSTSTIDITITDSLGEPIKGAKVVAYLPGVFMSSDSTDIRGEVTLPVFPYIPGSLSIYVEKEGYENFLGYATIVPVGNSIAITSKTLDPAFIKPGDTVFLSISIANTGLNPISDIVFTLEADSLVNILDSTEYLHNLQNGDTTNLTDAFCFVVDENILDIRDVQLSLTGLLPSGDTILTDTAGFTIYGSVIKPLFVSDSVSHDTIILNFGLENMGGSSCRVVLNLDSGNYRIISSTDTLNLDPVLVKETGYVFKIIPGTDFDSLINFSVSQGAVSREYHFKLGYLNQVVSVSSSPEGDGIKLSWQPVPDAIFYAIYRGNPQELAGVSRFASWYCDANSPETYRIAAIDTHGYRGRLSDPLTAYPHFPVKDGWPVYVEGGIYTSPLVYDFDTSYPGKEIFIASFPYGYVYLYHSDGTIVDGWPLYLDGEIWSSPAAADLDGDSIPEIVVALRSKNEVYAFKSNGTVLNGWPVHTLRGTYYTPAVGDIDGDGVPEIVINDQSPFLFVFRSDGSGFGDSSGVFLNISNTWRAGSPVLFDYDGDGRMDIGIGSRIDNQQLFIVVSAEHDTLFKIPISERISSPPVVGDFSADSAGEEILINDNTELKLFSHNGYLLPGWPIAGFFTAVTADVNYDGRLEIIGTTESGVAVYNSSGDLIMEKNLVGLDYYMRSPVIADVDDDRVPEILFESFLAPKLYSINLNGTVTHGFPFDLKEGPGNSEPVIEDVDEDGYLDIIIGSTFDSLWVLETSTPFNELRALWNMEKYDMARTGWVKFIPTEFHEESTVRELKLFPSVTNGELSFVPPENLKGSIEIEFYDVSGRRVSGFQFSQPHPVKLTLNSMLPDGIYFYRIKASSIVSSGKIMLLR